MSTRRTLPAPAGAVAAVALAAPLVLLHGTYRSLYPLILLVAVAVRMLGGRAAQAATLALAVVLGPVVWHLGADGGAAETVAVAYDAGASGLAAYARDFVLAPTPLRAWLLPLCLVLLGFVVADLAARAVQRIDEWKAFPVVRAAAAVVSMLVALLLAAPLLTSRFGEARRAWRGAERAREAERAFRARVDASVPRLDRAPLVSRRDVDVVLYVGESASRWDWSLYGYPRATTAALDRGLARDRMVAFTHAHAPARAGLASTASGLTSLPFLYHTRGDLVVPLAQTLARAGVPMVWVHGRHAPWAAEPAITGATRVAANARYDGGLLAPLRDLLSGASGRRLVVVETHAGRFPWCDEVPPARRRRWDDWMARLPDAAIWGDGLARRAALDCYDSAMRYAAESLRDAILLVDRAARPTVLVYVANRGEDAWGRIRGEGVARSARVTDVPLVVYANAAFASRHPDVLASARRHRDDLVATPWLHEALLDLLDVRTDSGAPAFDSTMSVFGRDFRPRDVVREPLTGVRDSVTCAHRANSLFKYLEAVREYRCAELDVVLDTAGGPAFVFHPPVSNSGLPLYELLAHAGVPPRGLWLDVKNLGERNATALAAHLSALVPADERGRVLVETSEDAVARSTSARAIADSGFVLSYYLSTDLGCECSRAGDAACRQETERLVRMLDGSVFRGVSFDARGRRLARAIRDRITPRPLLNAWTPMDRCANGDRAAPLDQAALDTLLGEVQKYLVRLPSSFAH